MIVVPMMLKLLSLATLATTVVRARGRVLPPPSLLALPCLVVARPVVAPPPPFIRELASLRRLPQ